MDLKETRERTIYEKEGAIARVTLNWPEKANAQDQKLVEEMDAALADADRDYDIKVLILKANGKGFCSGHPSATTPSTIRSSSKASNTRARPGSRRPTCSSSRFSTCGSFPSRRSRRCMATASAGAPITG